MLQSRLILKKVRFTLHALMAWLMVGALSLHPLPGRFEQHLLEAGNKQSPYTLTTSHNTISQHFSLKTSLLIALGGTG